MNSCVGAIWRESSYVYFLHEWCLLAPDSGIQPQLYWRDFWRLDDGSASHLLVLPWRSDNEGKMETRQSWPRSSPKGQFLGVWVRVLLCLSTLWILLLICLLQLAPTGPLTISHHLSNGLRILLLAILLMDDVMTTISKTSPPPTSAGLNVQYSQDRAYKNLIRPPRSQVWIYQSIVQPQGEISINLSETGPRTTHQSNWTLISIELFLLILIHMNDKFWWLVGMRQRYSIQFCFQFERNVLTSWPWTGSAPEGEEQGMSSVVMASWASED
jgi:hypothetical protein